MTILVDHVRNGVLQQIRLCVEARLHVAAGAPDRLVVMSQTFLTQTFRIEDDGHHTFARSKSWSAVVLAGAQPAIVTVRETREQFIFSSLRLGEYPERVIHAMAELEAVFASDPRRYRCRLVSLEGGVFSAVCLHARRKPWPYVIVADRRLLDRDALRVETNLQSLWARARAAATHSAQKTNLLSVADSP
jgi:hypothetical protein